MREHEIEISALLSYCFCDFHPQCGLATVMDVGGVGYVMCQSCKVLVHIDLAGHRISVKDGKESAHE